MIVQSYQIPCYDGTMVSKAMSLGGARIALIIGIPCLTGGFLVYAENAVQPFLNLQEHLPRMVCDESRAARAPFLPQVSPVLGRRPDRFRLKESWSEPQILSLMLGDPLTVLGSSDMLKGIASGAQGGVPFAQVEGLKRKFSVELCSEAIKPGGVKSLYQSRPGSFITADPQEARRSKVFQPVGIKTVMELIDTESRYLSIQGKWLVPGWVEFHEVLWAEINGRQYYRLTHPVTHSLRVIQILISLKEGGGPNFPVGYLMPSIEQPKVKWEALKEEAHYPSSRQQLIEGYLSRIEFDAFEAIEHDSELKGAIRQEMEKYRALVLEYRLHPEATKWKHFSESLKTEQIETEVRTRLDSSFWGSLSKARVNGAFVRFQLYPVDPVLYGVYREFSLKIAQIRVR